MGGGDYSSPTPRKTKPQTKQQPNIHQPLYSLRPQTHIYRHSRATEPRRLRRAPAPVNLARKSPEILGASGDLQLTGYVSAAIACKNFLILGLRWQWKPVSAQVSQQKSWPHARRVLQKFSAFRKFWRPKSPTFRAPNILATLACPMAPSSEFKARATLTSQPQVKLGRGSG